PAMRAVPSTSPFLALPERMSSSVAGLMTTRPSATASRSVAGLSETSTIRASPEAAMWGRAGLAFDVAFEVALDDALDIASALDGERAMSAHARGAGSVVAQQQRTRGSGHIGLPHQAFADQERRHADAFEAGEIGRCKDSAFADHKPIARDQ